jgi:hypothetical protein
MSSTTGVLYETGSTYRSGVHGFTMGFLCRVRVAYRISFLCWLFCLSSFFVLWPLLSVSFRSLSCAHCCPISLHFSLARVEPYVDRIDYFKNQIFALILPCQTHWFWSYGLFDSLACFNYCSTFLSFVRAKIYIFVSRSITTYIWQNRNARNKYG